MTPTWTEQQTAFWAAACEADEEAYRLWHQLSVLTRETLPANTAQVRRRANAVLAVHRRLQELLARLEANRG